MLHTILPTRQHNWCNLYTANCKRRQLQQQYTMLLCYGKQWKGKVNQWQKWVCTCSPLSLTKNSNKSASKTEIPPYSAPNSYCPPRLSSALSCRSHPSVPLTWFHLSQSSPKWEKTCPDSQTSMRSFTLLSFSAAEKSVTVQTKKHTIN